MNEYNLNDKISEIDKQTEILIDEFYSHYDEYIELRPEDAEKKNEIFQGWIIQKIAGIQISIIELAKQINALSKK
jgi:hypothetical protein